MADPNVMRIAVICAIAMFVDVGIAGQLWVTR